MTAPTYPPLAKSPPEYRLGVFSKARYYLTRMGVVFGSEPGVPAGRPYSSGERGLCVVCGETCYPSSFTMAPLFNAHNIEAGSGMAMVMRLRVPLKDTPLGDWFALHERADSLEDFARRDAYGGFWTPVGVVCRLCSGLPGVATDWRGEAVVARCFCGWEKAWPWDGDVARKLAEHDEFTKNLGVPPDSPLMRRRMVEAMQPGKAGHRAQRSLRGHLAVKHPAARANKPSPLK